MREINFLVGLNSTTPSSIQEGGYQCEYNATKVIFALDEPLLQQISAELGEQVWSVEAINGEGNMSVYPAELNGARVELVLPTEITLPGTTAQLQLVVTTLDENRNMLKKQCFSVVTIRFAQSVASLVDSNDYERYANNLIGAMNFAVDSAEVASQSAQASQLAAENAIDAALRAEAASKNAHWQYYETYEVNNEEFQAYRSPAFSADDGIIGVFVKTYAPVAERGAVVTLRALDTKGSEKVRIGTDGYVSTSKEAYGQIMLYLDRGLWDGWWLSATTSQSNVWVTKYGMRYDNAGKTKDDLPYIYRFLIGSTSGGYYLPVGMKLEMWVLKNG